MKKVKTLVCVFTAAALLFCGAVNSYAAVLGDVNCDGKRNADDLVTLRKMLLGTEDSLQTGDVNQDKNVDILDLVHLKKQLASGDIAWVGTDGQGHVDIY